MTFSLDKDEYELGEQVRIVMRARNRSADPCLMVHRDSGPLADIRIYAAEKLVSRLTRGGCRDYLTWFTEEVWEPGREEMYRATWQQRIDGDPDKGEDCFQGGEQVEPGRYQAVAVFGGQAESPLNLHRREASFEINDTSGLFL